MALGYCPALLRSIESIAGENAPSRKLHVAGFLAMTFCCQNSSVSPLNDAFPGEGQRTLTVSYRKRPVLTDVQDEDDCDINRIPVKAEWNFPTMRHKQTSFYMSDDQVSRYCSEFLQSVQIGQPATTMIRENYDNFLESANILLRAINKDLVTLMSTEFGANVNNSGLATAKTINIAQSSVMDLDAGVIEMLRDFQENEICGDPCIVGGGLWAGYNIAQRVACCSAAGIDVSRLGVPKSFYDKDTGTVLGANNIGVFSPGSVKFIGRNKYVGTGAGEKGGSIFFTVALPVNEFGCAPECLNDLIFDVQMKYFDCPTAVTINGSATTLPRGWEVIVSKDYTLWVQPTTGYSATDPLFGTNGTLRYNITNT